MTEQNFHEIQLSGKQLVFVFMSAVVVAVGIFLLGVSVGRGVKSSLPGAATTTVDAGPATEPAPAPAPAATPAPGDPTYHDILQGKDAKGTPASGSSTPSSQPAQPPTSTAPPPTPPPAAPPPASAEKANAKSAEPKGNDAKSGKSDSKAADTKAADMKAGSGNWFVQVGAFSTKEAADKQVQQLKAKAFTAFVYPVSSPVPRFHVRLGPFSQRADADRMVARLAKEGHQSLVTR